MAVEVTKQIYKPSMTVGQVYARVYGSAGLPLPIGNVLELALEHSEDVQTQEDMTRLGGGTHAEVRRVKEVKLKAKLADLNVVNMARSVFGTVEAIGAGTVQAAPYIATRGGLLPIAHISPTAVEVKKGTDAASATPVPMAGNYEVRPEGIFLLAGSLQPKLGGAIIAHATALPELQARVNDDPFVVHDVVAAEILSITPGKADERLAFLLG